MAASSAAADVTVTFWTTPAGATLTDSGRAWGATPFALTYKTPRRWTTCLDVHVRARWISGAESDDTPLRICPQQGKTQTAQIGRPADAPGLEADMSYGVQVQQLAVLQQQLAVQRSMAQNQEWANAYATVTAALANVRQRPRIACRSTADALGLTVWTTCQ